MKKVYQKYLPEITNATRIRVFDRCLIAYVVHTELLVLTGINRIVCVILKHCKKQLLKVHKKQIFKKLKFSLFLPLAGFMGMIRYASNFTSTTPIPSLTSPPYVARYALGSVGPRIRQKMWINYEIWTLSARFGSNVATHYATKTTERHGPTYILN